MKNNRKATIFADFGTLALAALLACACGCKLWDAAREEAEATARKISGADAIEARVGGLEERQNLLFGYVGAVAEKQGVDETAARDWLAGKPATPEESEEEAAAEESEADKPQSPDEADFAAFKWSFGGVDGSRAALDSPRLSKLKASAKSVSYHWDKGLSGWGLADAEAGALACLFVQTEKGEWRGGKFDWVSTSRSSRGLENVFDGYHGWSLSGVPNPCKIAFVVISANGKKRSNVIAAEWKR